MLFVAGAESPWLLRPPGDWHSRELFSRPCPLQSCLPLLSVTPACIYMVMIYSIRQHDLSMVHPQFINIAQTHIKIAEILKFALMHVLPGRSGGGSQQRSNGVEYGVKSRGS